MCWLLKWLLVVCVWWTGQVECGKNYATALSKSILFLNTQRSGKLPINNPIPWRGDSGLNDCVVGGWYDAGDHVKFGQPMASAATILLWSLYRFKDAYSSTATLDSMYDMIKWPLDYFLNAWNASAQQFVAQIGDGNTDHAYWGRPEDMTMVRPCIYINTTFKGSDVLGETVAALAAGSITFQAKGAIFYSEQLYSAAKSLYAFAMDNRGLYNGSRGFYDSTSESDEMCNGAMWLYRATNDSTYLDYARTLADFNVPWSYDWDNKQASCLLLLYEETHEDKYQQALVNYFDSWLAGGTMDYTPCGLAWRFKWGSLREMANTAFLALLAAESGIQTNRLRQWAVQQINYILGDNTFNGGCFSFQIGVGNKYPLQPHHRAASCPDKPAPCGWDNFNSPLPNPHVLQGALVGGPLVDDSYEDKRDNYVLNEVSTDYNAGYQGALSGLLHLENLNSLPIVASKCPCLD
ncbi:endoglucanase A [Biomphalaria pfeifferi]|uniref:Endoglucanase n=1 Tax=Biomphalaria pfeifferi TaxID=112525 RepID=A0AAD8BSB8_BIOPF|nr:endoglucanase A [Biomphalaria pfeifferi]